MNSVRSTLLNSPSRRITGILLVFILVFGCLAGGVVSALAPVATGDGIFPAPGLRQGPFELPEMQWEVNPDRVLQTNLPGGSRLLMYSVAGSERTVWRVTYTAQPDFKLSLADWGLVDSHSVCLGQLSDALQPVSTLLVQTPKGPLLVGHVAPADFGGAIASVTIAQPHSTMVFDFSYCLDILNSSSNFRCIPATREVLFAWPVVPDEVGQVIIKGSAPTVTRDFSPARLQLQAHLP